MISARSKIFEDERHDTSYNLSRNLLPEQECNLLEQSIDLKQDDEIDPTLDFEKEYDNCRRKRCHVAGLMSFSKSVFFLLCSLMSLEFFPLNEA